MEGVRVAVEKTNVAGEAVPSAALGRLGSGGQDDPAVVRTGAGRHDPVRAVCGAGEGEGWSRVAGVPRLSGAAAVELSGRGTADRGGRGTAGVRCAGAPLEPAGTSGHDTGERAGG